ncbi:CPZ-55 prophage protein [Escherichia coli]|nr:hypothetical protein DAH17_04760 [Escherichia coli]SQJ32792.1 CPZ-55 prophage protein [Escherichia coli]SQJ65892.1 CPZ-55 prophage protein [Escherichia coli]
MLALKIVHGMAREISERSAYILHSCPACQLPAKRTALRCFAELVLGTINRLISMKQAGDNGSLRNCNAEEERFVRRLKLIKSDIHAQLRACNCEISE